MTIDPTEVWRGGVNAWECDDMGHFNTRFYVARVEEGLAGFMAQLGLPGVFGASSATTVCLRQMHIRFLREAHVGTPLHLLGRVLSHGEHDAELLLMMHDAATGELKASFRLQVDHVDAGNVERCLPWPDAFRQRAAARTGLLPPEAAPRSAGFGPVESVASLDAAERMGLARIGLGSIRADKVDAFGRMVAHAFIGSVSDGIRNVTGPLREIVLHHSQERPERYGGAVLEFRVVHRRWPRAGDCYEIRSGLQKADGSVMSLMHWMLDPVGGEVYGTMQSVAVVFDLDRRKIVRISDAARAELKRHSVAGLDL